MATTQNQLASLRASLPSFGDVTVDAEAGIIRNASVMTVGPALGYGWELDGVSLSQLVDAIAANGGEVKVRFRHPAEHGAEDLGTDVGMLRNVRLDGDQVRGDIHLAEYAKHLPGQGDVRSYLLGKAEHAPKSFGLSAVIGFDLEEIRQGGSVRLVARINMVDAVDFVGKPAANPNGLLSQPAGALPATVQPPVASAVPAASPVSQVTKKGATPMEFDPTMIPSLIDMGLSAEADEAAAKVFYDALSDEEKQEVAASLSAKAVPAKLSAKPTQKAASLRTQVVTDEGDKLLAVEGKRVAQLQQLGNVLKVPGDVVALSIAAGEDVIDGRKRFLDHLTANAKPVATGGASITVGDDLKIASLKEAIPDAIMLRAGVSIAKPHARAAQLRQQSVLGMFQHYLVALGIPQNEAFAMGKTQLVNILGPRAFRQTFPQFASLAQSTSDFSSILENSMRKSLRTAYDEYPTTWSQWATRNTTPDFKTVSRPQLSQSPDLTVRKEGGDIKYATITDSKETYVVNEFVSGIKLTRQALLNDDLNAFASIPKKQGQAARRLEDAMAYGVLNANAALSDSVALFHATHANLVASGSGAAPSSVTALDTTNKLLRKQTGLGGVGKLNLTANVLLVPTALEVTAQQFAASVVDPSKNNTTPNPFVGKYKVIASPFLDSGNLNPITGTSAGSDVAWYLVSNMIENVEVCFLSDEPEPVLRQETDFDTEDMKFAVRHTIGAAAIEFRGMSKNFGS